MTPIHLSESSESVYFLDTVGSIVLHRFVNEKESKMLNLVSSVVGNGNY